MVIYHRGDSMSVWSNLKFICKEIKELRTGKVFIYILFYWITSVLVSVLTVVLPSYAVGILLLNNGLGKVLLMVGLLAVFQILKNGFHLKAKNETFSFRILENIKHSEQMINLPIPYVESKEGQSEIEKANLAVSAGNQIGVEAFIDSFYEMMMNLFCTLAYVLIFAKLNIWIIILLVAVPCIKSVFDHFYRKWQIKNRPRLIDSMKKFAYLNSHCLNIGEGKDIRLFRLKELFHQKYIRAIDYFMGYYGELQDRRFLGKSFSWILGLMRNVICIIYLIYQVKQGMDASSFVLYMGVIVGINQWLDAFFQKTFDLLENNIVVTDYRNYLNIPHYYDGDFPNDLPEGPYEIVFDHVYFKYREDAPWVIEDLCLTIRAGEKLALVGPNGAGKSTLIKLLSGLYKPTKGRILLNGVDITTINPKDLYEHFSLVFQDVTVFAFEIGENIACCPKDEIDEEKLVNVMKKAGIYDDVMKLPKTWHTPLTRYLSDEGFEMSGGQYQRLMLARALYKEGDILILDEPTSALDPLAEAELYQKYYELADNRTSIFISHRLSSTQFCNRVLYLENGKIVQEGTHDELMMEEGPYRTMFETQARYYQEKEANLWN